MQPLILHLDLDSFFASAEQANNPSLFDKPLVVGTPSKRAVVTAASYKAKSYGIKAGMPFFIARKLCSNLVIVPANFSLYSHYSGLFFNYLKKNITRNMEIGSIDECSLNVTSVFEKKKKSYDRIMREIQEGIFKKLRLQVSLGLSFNKEFAKIAANMNKPLGIKIITRANFREEIWPLSVSEISGIGKATLPYIYALKINHIGDLANFKNKKLLKNILGKNTEYFCNVAQGKGTTKLNILNTEQKSLSKEHTFDKFLTSDEDIIAFLKELSISVWKRIIQANLVFGVIRIAYKNTLKQRHSVQLTLDKKTDRWEKINEMIPILFEKIKNKQPFLLLSFGLASLENKFDYFQRINEKWSLNDIGHDTAMFLNKKFGKRIVMTGTEWEKQRKINIHDRFLKGDKNER